MEGHAGAIRARSDGDSLDIEVTGTVPQHIIDAVRDRFGPGEESSSRKEKEEFVESNPKGAFLPKKMFKSEGEGLYSPRSPAHKSVSSCWKMRRDIGGPGWGYSSGTYFFYPVEE